MSAGNLYCGVVIPMLSPFTPAGRIDEPAVARIVNHLLNHKLAGIFALGTTGESSSIHHDEKRRLVAATVQAVAGRATVYAGISSNSVQESLEAARDFQKLGARAAVAHVPSYFPISDKQIESYFHRLADEIPLPLVLYNIPSTTHHTIPLDAIDRLRNHPNIVALKDSANDPQRITQLLNRTGGRNGFPVLLGSSPQFAHGLKLGGVGLIPSGGHLIPDLYQSMYEAAMDEQWETVDQLQKQTETACAGYLKGRSLAEGLAVLKARLEARGLCARTMLPPLTDHVGPE